MARLSLVLVTTSLFVACALRKEFQVLPLDGGPPAQVAFTSGLFASGGKVEGLLADGRRISGRWSETDSGTNLALFSIPTSGGPLTAMALAQTGVPRGVATLNGDGITVLCVFQGSYSSGVAFCGDSDGRRYAGNW